MKIKWAGIMLALSVVLLAGCKKVYVIVDEPTAPLARFGKVVIGKFNITDFLESIESAERRDKYSPVAKEANVEVIKTLEEELKNWQGTAGGPSLVLSAVMDDFATGSGAMRALSHFGVFGGPHHSNTMLGQGLIEYTVTLKSGSSTVATYKVGVKITGKSLSAYRLEARNIAKFLFDEM